MAISFSCGHCGKSLTTSEDKAGRQAKCPGCGEILTVPQSVPAGGDFDSEEEDSEDLPKGPPPLRKRAGSTGQTCPMCGASNPRQASSCNACGEELEPRENDRRVRTGEYEYAGFWLRFAAAVIDNLLLGCVGGVVGGMAGFMLAIILIGANQGNPNVVQQPGMELMFQLIGNAIGLLLGWLYFGLMESSAKQATLGKMAVGIQVCDLDGRRLTFGRASGRYFGKILSGVICLAGYIMAAFTERKQALHDQLAGTLVVRS